MAQQEDPIHFDELAQHAATRPIIYSNGSDNRSLAFFLLMEGKTDKPVGRPYLLNKKTSMKKFLFVSILSLSAILSQAQHTDWGVKGGFNFSNMSYENSTNPDLRFSGHLGVLAHVHLTRQFAVQPELLFSGQGARETISGTKYTIALNYINLPILGQIMVGNGWRLETGPQFGTRVSAKLKEGGNSRDIGDGFKTFDFGWVFGVGYLTGSGFGVDARYNYGISNINDGSEGVHNRVFAVGVFYQLRGR